MRQRDPPGAPGLKAVGGQQGWGPLGSLASLPAAQLPSDRPGGLAGPAEARQGVSTFQRFYHILSNFRFLPRKERSFLVNK